jgi:galacturonokinase
MIEQEDINRLRDDVAARYHVPRADVRVVFSPYRVCPLGAHIDHQLGCVTAVALDRGVLLAYAPSAEPEARLTSRDFPGDVAFRFDQIPDRREGDWGNYARGAVRALRQHFPLRCGLRGITHGSVAEGGLSSSAAVGVAYLLALEDVNGLQVTARDNILLDQYIENTYLGLRNGILDQSAILLSRRDHLTIIDCGRVTHELVSRPGSMQRFSLLIVFSGLREALVTTDYNRRVGECAAAARLLLDAAGRSTTPPLLGHVSAEEYAKFADRLTGAPARRARHYFSESDRVQRGIDAWRRGDLAAFGRLITASGESSINSYQCGAPPLVDLYQALVDADGVYGARFSGAGFRGCCLAVIDPASKEEVAAHVLAEYAQRHPELAGQASAMVCETGDGARLVGESRV